jgi:HD-GYP domain-containing protein (c-di-GMP phosphodiesterase class II)
VDEYLDVRGHDASARDASSDVSRHASGPPRVGPSPAARSAVLGPALAGAGAVAAAWVWSARRRAPRDMALHRVLVELLLNALSAGDASTERHSRRVADLADALHATYRPTRAAHATLRLGALLHDLGKIDDRFFAIVHGRAPLTLAQRAELTGHPAESAHILAPLEPYHPGLLDVVRSHHERWDGRGYPRGLAGTAIPLAARVIAAADVFDALTQPRGYKAGWPVDAALAELRQGSGALFDPDVVARVQRPEVVARWYAIAAEGRAAEEAAPPADVAVALP